MKYFKYYIVNFAFVNQIIGLAIWYNSIIFFSSSKSLLKFITNEYINNKISYPPKEEFIIINKKIDKIINKVPLKRTCLIRSLIKRNYYYSRNYFVHLEFGFNVGEEKIVPHSRIKLSENYKNSHLKKDAFISVKAI